jgi:formamidopyrimidine-DNA glycosylase
LAPTNELDRDDFVARLGPDPLDPDFDWRLLRQRLQPRKISVSNKRSKSEADSKKDSPTSGRSIKAALLDQETLAGVGNIYADESLFMACINPRRSASSLTVPELKRLTEALRERLTCSINDGGSTARNYVDALGLRGEFLDLHAQVYGRSGQACLKCGSKLEKTRVAGRGTVFCPKCQK